MLASLPVEVEDADLRRVAARLAAELAGVSVLAVTESEPMGTELVARLAGALAQDSRRVLVVDGGGDEGGDDGLGGGSDGTRYAGRAATGIGDPSRLAARLRGLTRDADLVLLKTPSARSAAGRQLAALAEGVLLLAPTAAKQEVNEAAKVLVESGARLVGVVLTERP